MTFLSFFNLKNLSIVTFMTVFMAGSAYAALPWEGPLIMIQESLSGPTAKAAAIIVMVVSGLLIAFTEVSGIFGHLAKVVFGLSLALMAAQWLAVFSGF